MIKRFVFTAAALLMIGTVSVYAHHSYADFLRDQIVSVDGTIEKISFSNPHVMLVIKTSDTQTYTAEWSSINGLSRFGVTSTTLKVGDRIVVTGSPKRDPGESYLSLLREVRRPADGWSWKPTPARSAAN